MPRAHRCILPGEVYHLTHRCHHRQFFLRSEDDRTEYCSRLASCLRRHGVSLLDYSITRNHTHLLAVSNAPRDISRMIQQLDGEFAACFNRRQGLKGSFWDDRFHGTMVDDGVYLWNCLRYIDLNMLRAGVVSHPKEWAWCGYCELMGLQVQFRLLDTDRLLQLLEVRDLEDFRTAHESRITVAIAEKRLHREPQWADAVAVGSETYITAIAERLGRRKRFHLRPVPDGGWYVL